MNKKELFECLSGLSKTNNLRDGIDIRKEEANIIVKEIERLKEELKYTIPIVEHNKTITKHLKEIERLHSIIKEVREYIENRVMSSNEIIDGLKKTEVKELLEILEKENK